MQALAWTVRIAVVLVLVWFAARNSQPVTVHGLPDQSWQAPLVFVVLVGLQGIAMALRSVLVLAGREDELPQRFRYRTE